MNLSVDVEAHAQITSSIFAEPHLPDSSSFSGDSLASSLPLARPYATVGAGEVIWESRYFSKGCHMLSVSQTHSDVKVKPSQRGTQTSLLDMLASGGAK